LSKRSGAVASDLRRIPSVEKLVSSPPFERLAREFGRGPLLDATREILATLRESVRSGTAGKELDRALDELEPEARRRLEALAAPSLVRVVNATGIIVHTNLGRAPLSVEAIDAITAIARGYCNLELDLESGKRGSRHRHAERLLGALFPARKALVVNNAAAAVMLSLNTFALGKEVVISRGELVEIGGAFRVPEILERSGARLREVGTTNKTRIEDYRNAIGPATGAILRVHPSNFRIVGFTEAAGTDELVRLGIERGLPVIEDFGSGNLHSLREYGLPREPTVSESLAAGVSLSIFSGDKLLGGPQAGILVGDPAMVEACRRNPMARALRADKLVYAALEATLSSHLRERALEEIPVLRMLAQSPEEVRARSEALVERFSRPKGVTLEVEPGVSHVGGGAAPDAELKTWVVAVASKSASADSILTALRKSRPPVIARISEDRVLIDLRTVAPEEECLVERALSEATAPDRPGDGR
jgi:L-seryl-tRNA(Ser) seleniumtransferase